MSSAEFHPEYFEDMIGRRGKSLRWERARQCPCYDEKRRSPRMGCSDCGGLGKVYTTQTNPADSTPSFTASVLSVTSSKKFAKFGQWEAGDCVCTYPESMLLGEGDRLTLTNVIERETDLLIRGARDVLIEPDVVEVLECGDEERLYTPGTDFAVVGSEITWNGAQPALGASYSVIYTARPAYVVWLQLPQHRRLIAEAGREMPRKCVLRRWRDVKRPPNA
jgi:hypothetical protein